MLVQKYSRFYHAAAAACALFLPAAQLGAASAFAAAAPNAAAAQSFAGAYLAGSYAADIGGPLAAAYFRRALQIAPQDKIVRRELLLSLIDDGNYPAAAAVAATMRADADATILPIVQLVLAADLLKKHQYARVDALVGKDGNKQDSLLWVFFTCWADYGSGQKNKALRNLSQARFSEWYDFLSIYNTALMLDLDNAPKQAAAAYKKALDYRQMADMAPEAYEHLIRAYVGFMRRTQGQKAALSALETAQPEADAPTSSLLALRRDLERGKTVPRLVGSPAQGAAEFAYTIGSTFLRAGEDLYAAIYLQTALFLRPKDDSTLFRLGILAAKAKETDKANAFFAQIPPSSPYYSDAEILTALSINQNLTDKSEQDKKKDTQAAALLEKMIARSSNKAALQNVLANIYLQNGNYSAAIALLNTMLSGIKQPEKRDWSVYFQRGIAYERAKQWDKAEADFKQALLLNPQNADVLNYYGYSLADRGIKLAEGLEMVRRAAQLQPQNGAVADSLGWAYYRLGRYDEAVEALEKAVRLDPGESSINDHLGDAYWKIGKKRDAVFQWNHALAFKPETAAEAAAINAKLRSGLPDSAAQSGKTGKDGGAAPKPSVLQK